MGIVERALWQIESRLVEIGSLEEAAARTGVTPFTLALGLPVMRYVRGRRLSEAARLGGG